MAKRKAASSSDDGEYNSDSFSGSGSGSPQPKPAINNRKSRQTKSGQRNSGKSSANESETEKPLVKRPKKEKNPELATEHALRSDGDPVVHSTRDGEKYIVLGKKKRATVRTFKGTTLLDIREFYDNGGEEKPGKKGISLTEDQWQMLNNSSAIIDDLFAKQKK